jgi:putative transposase
MPRKLRLEYAGACYHVINRGNYRRDLFSGKGATESFEVALFEACAQFKWRLHAFVVMRNHFHLAVETPEPNLSDGMRWLQATWAVRFNRFHGEVGRPFQGRYKALHVERGHSLAQVAHYIHLNPVRAKIVKAEALPAYRWSSVHWFLQRHRPACLSAETLLLESGGLRDSPAGWRRYLDYLALLAEEDRERREERFGRLSRGWHVGSDNFKAELVGRLQAPGRERFEMLGADRQAHLQLRVEMWETTLRRLARRLRVDLVKLGSRRSAPEKVKLAAAMKAITSASNAWLAKRLDMGAPASVSQYVRRFRLSGGNTSRDFKRVLSNVIP